MKVFAEAFDAALAAGHVVDAPSGLEGFPISQVSLGEVRTEFFSRYLTGAGDAKKAAETKSRQWRNALADAAAEFDFGVVGDIERAWRRQDLMSFHQ
jgi:hypothetical protein